MWVVNAGRPLTLRELALAVSIEPDSRSHKVLEAYGQQVVLDTCGNLLVENDGIVRPVHYTVQEFLTAGCEMNQTVLSTGNPILRQYQSNIHLHSKLAEICLQYLCFEEIESCKRIKPAKRYDPEYPFGLYAATYWDYHVQRLPDSSLPGDLARSIDKFLDSKGITLTIAYHMRESVYRGQAVLINPLNYCLAFNMLHLYQLSHRLDASVVGEEHKEALHHAAASGSTAAIEILLGMGFSVHTRDTQDEYPLHYAARSGRRAAVELLLDRGADIDAVNDVHMTALETVAWEGDEVLMRVLLERGAAINLPDGSNRGFVLVAAAKAGVPCVVRMLLDRGANVNFTGTQVTPWPWRPRKGTKT